MQYYLVLAPLRTWVTAASPVLSILLWIDSTQSHVAQLLHRLLVELVINRRPKNSIQKNHYRFLLVAALDRVITLDLDTFSKYR